MAVTVRVPEVNQTYNFPDNTTQDEQIAFIAAKHPEVIKTFSPEKQAFVAGAQERAGVTARTRDNRSIFIESSRFGETIDGALEKANRAVKRTLGRFEQTFPFIQAVGEDLAKGTTETAKARAQALEAFRSPQTGQNQILPGEEISFGPSLITGLPQLLGENLPTLALTGVAGVLGEVALPFIPGSGLIAGAAVAGVLEGPEVLARSLEQGDSVQESALKAVAAGAILGVLEAVPAGKIAKQFGRPALKRTVVERLARETGKSVDEIAKLIPSRASKVVEIALSEGRAEFTQAVAADVLVEEPFIETPAGRFVVDNFMGWLTEGAAGGLVGGSISTVMGITQPSATEADAIRQLQEKFPELAEVVGTHPEKFGLNEFMKTGDVLSLARKHDIQLKIGDKDLSLDIPTDYTPEAREKAFNAIDPGLAGTFSRAEDNRTYELLLKGPADEGISLEQFYVSIRDFLNTGETKFLSEGEQFALLTAKVRGNIVTNTDELAESKQAAHKHLPEDQQKVLLDSFNDEGVAKEEGQHLLGIMQESLWVVAENLNLPSVQSLVDVGNINFATLTEEEALQLEKDVLREQAERQAQRAAAPTAGQTTPQDTGATVVPSPAPQVEAKPLGPVTEPVEEVVSATPLGPVTAERPIAPPLFGEAPVQEGLEAIQEDAPLIGERDPIRPGVVAATAKEPRTKLAAPFIESMPKTDTTLIAEARDNVDVAAVESINAGRVLRPKELEQRLGISAQQANHAYTQITGQAYIPTAIQALADRLTRVPTNKEVRKEFKTTKAAANRQIRSLRETTPVDIANLVSRDILGTNPEQLRGLLQGTEIERISMSFSRKESIFKGMFIPFRTGDSTALIRFVKGRSDASTAIHEMAHFLSWRASGKALKFLEELVGSRKPGRRKAGVKRRVPRKDWDAASQEFIAESFEIYVMHQVAPTPELQIPFAAMSARIRQVWLAYSAADKRRAAKGVSPELREIFDNFFIARSSFTVKDNPADVITEIEETMQSVTPLTQRVREVPQEEDDEALIRAAQKLGEGADPGLSFTGEDLELEDARRRKAAKKYDKNIITRRIADTFGIPGEFAIDLLGDSILHGPVMPIEETMAKMNARVARFDTPMNAVNQVYKKHKNSKAINMTQTEYLMMLAASSQVATNIAEKIRMGESGDAQLKDLMEKMVVLRNQNSAAGRTLRYSQEFLNLPQATVLLAQLHKELSETERITMTTLMSEGRYSGVVKFLRSRRTTKGGRFWAKMQKLLPAYLYMNILSNPQTHQRNIYSTGSMLAFDMLPGQIGRVGADMLFSAAQGRSRSVYLRELGPMLSAGLRGLPNAFKVAKERIFLQDVFIKDGILEHKNRDWHTKTNREIGDSVTTLMDVMALSTDSKVDKAIGVAVGTVPRMLFGADMFFKMVAKDVYNAQFAARTAEWKRRGVYDENLRRWVAESLSRRQQTGKETQVVAGTGEVIETAELTERDIEDLLKKNPEIFQAFKDNPEMLIRTAAEEYMELITFQSEPGKMTKQLIGFRDAFDDSIGLPIARWLFIPFISTPINVAKRGTELTPILGLAARRWGSSWKEITANQIVAGVGALALYQMFKAGFLTGPPPEDDREYAAFLRAGGKPYAVQFKHASGEISYWRVPEPFNIPFVTLGNLFYAYDKAMDAENEVEALEIASHVIWETFRFMGKNVFFSGLLNSFGPRDQWDFAKEPKRKAQAVVPYAGFLRYVAETQQMYEEGRVTMKDDNFKLSDFATQERTLNIGLMKLFGDSIPGLRKQLPDRLNALGTPITKRQIPETLPQGWLISTSLVPDLSIAKNDPLEQIFFEADAYPSPTSRNMSINNRKIELTEEQHLQANLRYGMLIREMVPREAAGFAWKTAPQWQKRLRLQKVLSAARTRTNLDLRRTYPDLFKKAAVTHPGETFRLPLTP